MKLLFEPSVHEGCAPLKVQFHNKLADSMIHADGHLVTAVLQR